MSSGTALTEVSNFEDCEQKWQSSGQPPVLRLMMPSTSTERIQEAHITVIHLFCELLERTLYPETRGAPAPRREMTR